MVSDLHSTDDLGGGLLSPKALWCLNLRSFLLLSCSSAWVLSPHVDMTLCRLPWNENWGWRTLTHHLDVLVRLTETVNVSVYVTLRPTVRLRFHTWNQQIGFKCLLMLILWSRSMLRFLLSISVLSPPAVRFCCSDLLSTSGSPDGNKPLAWLSSSFQWLFIEKEMNSFNNLLK